MTRNLQNTIFDVKKLLGRKFKELAHIRESKDWPFRVVKGRRDSILVQLSSFRDRSHKKDVYIESLCTAILADLKTTAESRLRG